MTELQRLRAFVDDLFEKSNWPYGGDIDGFDFQELCVQHGLLVEHRVTQPCSEEGYCQCAEYYGLDEMAEGVLCYFRPKWSNE